MATYRVEIKVYGTEVYEVEAESPEDAVRRYRRGPEGNLVGRTLNEEEDTYVLVIDPDNNIHEIED